MAATYRSLAPAESMLQAYSPALAFTRLAVGVDNIRHDVYLSPRWREQASQFLSQQILQHAQPYLRGLYLGHTRAPGTGSFRSVTETLLRESLTQAKQSNNVEMDLLARVSVYQYLRAEMLRQFGELTLTCKEQIKKRSSLLLHNSMESFQLHSRLADFQSAKRHILRSVGATLAHLFETLEENKLRPSRAALFGSEFFDLYRVVCNRLVFLENPNDAVVHLEHYVLLGHYPGDVDQDEKVQALLEGFLRRQGLVLPERSELFELEKLRDKTVEELQEVSQRLRELELEVRESGRREPRGLSSLFRSGRSGKSERAAWQRETKRLELRRQQLAKELEEQEQKVAYLRQAREARLEEVLSNPANAKFLFGPLPVAGCEPQRTNRQEALLRELFHRMERARVLKSVLASYSLRPLYREFCPPLNPQHLKRAVLDRQGWEEFEILTSRFPSRNFPVQKLEEVARKLRRMRRSEAEEMLVRFAHDVMRLRHDLLHLRVLHSLMEKIHLVADEKTRQVSRMNCTLHEFLLPEEQEGGEDRVLSHVVIKADIRDSTRITQELLQRGLNPATHFSSNFFEPVRKVLPRFHANKLFLEGDALILGIFENVSNSASRHPVATACLLAKEIIEICQAYNQRAQSNDLPVLELGLGVAYQEGTPHYWTDGESRIMISPALNLSDRYSSCTRLARRLLSEQNSSFNVHLFQSVPTTENGTAEEDILIRFNVMGAELNEAGFQRLQREISLHSVEGKQDILGAEERFVLHYGAVPIGKTLEKLVIRESCVPRLKFPEQQVAEWTERRYYEICMSPELHQRFPSAPAR